MNYLKISGIAVGIIVVGLGLWLFYARIIKTPATTFQKAKEMSNYSYHYDYHPVLGFGCMKIPKQEQLK